MSLLKVEVRQNLHVVDSESVATELGVQHKNLLETVAKYQDEIEGHFGKLAFETRVNSRGPLSRVAYFTEDQALFIATLARNTETVVTFKANLVKAFQSARQIYAEVSKPLSDAEMKLKVFNLLTQEAESLREQNRLLESTIQQQAPKVQYHDKVLSGEGGIPITLIAKELGMSAITLNKDLKIRGVQWRVGGAWVLTSKYQGQGYTLSRTVPYVDTMGNIKTRIDTLWTEKGRQFLHNIILKTVPA